MAELVPIARIALLAVVVIALDAAWWVAPGRIVSAGWPRTAATARCTLTIHEPRQDAETDATGARTLRLAFACARVQARGRGPESPSTIRGTAVVIGDPLAEGGPYALSGARVALIAFPTVLDPDSDDARECRTAVESLLSGTALDDADARWRPAPPGDPLLAGPDSRVYSLRDGAWWREETDGSWSRIAEQGSAAARRDARLAPLERAMAERQPRDGR